MKTAEALGRYEIIEELGRGAMGVVYLAQDPALGRLVALKALTARSGSGDSPGAASFLREARAAGNLDHPNIVTVHDVGGGEQPFIAMEYVQGTDLKELLRPHQPLPHDFALEVVDQVAAALDYAHARGVVHRDVKPGNILITADEQVKLTDFGIASAPGDDGGSDRFGTPHYVAPEQLLGEPVDARADVFSLGVVIYEMLTGRRPFDGPEVEEVVRRLAYEPHPSPAEQGEDLPDAVATVFDRALAKQPRQRFSSAGELAQALRAALTGRDEAATRDLSDLLPEPPPPSPSSRPHRRPLLWGAAVAAALLAAASGWGLVQLSAGPAPAPPSPAPPHRLEAPHAELVREADRLVAADDPLTALRLLDLAVEMAPHRAELRQLRALVADSAAAHREQLARDGEVDRLLVAAQRARLAGRYPAALTALRRAAELDPEQPAVRELLRRVESARARQAVLEERRRPQPAPTAPQIADPAPPPPPPPARSGPKTVPAWADLRIDFFSQLPRGVLTLYAGGEQVLAQPFRFGKRSGLFRKQIGAGRLEARQRLPAGETELRIYVTLPGQSAASTSVRAHLTGGSSRVLRILIDAQGELRAQLD